ncbi:MAG: transglutaminaseTgpA domain-containing protein [Verrucomicrobiota bacterium]
MGLVSISTVFNIGGHNPIPAFVSIVAVSVCLVFRKLYLKIPSKVWAIYAVLILPIVSIDVFAKETIPALLNLNTWLVLYRSLNHTRRREEMQLVLLCLFLLVMTGILTASLIFALQLLIFTGLAMAMLVLGAVLENRGNGIIRMDREFRNASLNESLSTAFKVVNPRYAFLGVAVFSLMLGVAGMTFLVIPRIDVENKVSLFKMPSTGSLSGFSESIKLGEVTNIKNDNRIALRVDVPESAEVPVTPYFRMLALDRYENGSLSLSKELKDLLRSTLASPNYSIRYWTDKRFSKAPSGGQGAEPWTFFLEPNVSRFIPIAGEFSQMTMVDIDSLKISPHIHVFGFQEPNSKMLSYQLENVDFSGDIRDLSAYEYPIFLDNLLGEREGSVEEDTIYPQTLLSVPEDPEIRRYLEQEVEKIYGGRALNRREFAEAAVNYLHERHSYSMSISLPPANGGIEDPVIRWMQSDLPGHCEFFSSSLILLTRAAGISSRAIVGYKGGAWNAYENYFMVRNADAHAWCEVYDGVDTWFRVDPTPGSSLPSTSTPTVMATSKLGESGSTAYIDSLRMLWYRRIVNFDEAAQREAAVQLREFAIAYIEVAEQWASEAIKYLVEWATTGWTVWRILYLLFLALLLVGAIMLQRNMALNFRELLVAPFRRGDPIRRKASKLLKKCESRLEKLGEAEELLRLREDLRRLRFGPKETWPKARQVFKGARSLL